MSFNKMILFICAMLFIAVMPIASICAQENKQAVVIETQVQNEKGLLHTLTYAADEETYRRKKTGFQVVGFLLIYAFIMWRVKKRVWKDAYNIINDSHK